MGKKKVKVKEKKLVVFDADYLIFRATESKDAKMSYFKKRTGKSLSGDTGYKEPLKKYKKKLKKEVQDTMRHIKLETMKYPWNIKKKPLLIFSDPNNNFRYELHPEYKGHREPRPELFNRLKKWAIKKFHYPENFEADDLVSHFAREGALVVSFDKDVYRSTAGVFYNPHQNHKCIIETSHEEAIRFTHIQTLTGDATDNIPALPKKAGDPMIDGIPTPNVRKPFKVTEKLAIELLDKHGWHWEGVVRSFESKGFTEKEAILNRRLICMNQLRVTETGEYKLELFNPKKE